MQETVEYWLHGYDWEKEQSKINQMPQFKAKIEHEEFGVFDMHFVHARACPDEGANAIPLLFLHGWPGNFTEVAKILGPLGSAGYHVVAPSLPGYGFSSYTHKAGFKHWHHAEVMHLLMKGLGYDKYVVAGGDWGAMITGSMALMYPEHVQAIHLTNVCNVSTYHRPRKYAKPSQVFVLPPKDKDQLSYSDFELGSLAVMKQFQESESAYGQVQTTKPRTLGFAMHDSPVGMLAWMADKLLQWSDAYPWTRDEIITWTLLHYFPGPTTAFQMYRENIPLFLGGKKLPTPGAVEGRRTFVEVPTGVSAFAKEVYMVPRSWAEKSFNVLEWKEQRRGGHFPAHERPDELCADLTSFLRSHWNLESSFEPA